MRITCPNCEATYDVPEAKLVGRKAVRCSRCGQDWTPEVTEPPADPEPDPPPAPEPTHRLDLSRVVDAESVPIAAEPEQRPPPAPPLRPSAGEFTAMERLVRAAEPPPPSVWLRVAWVVSILLVLLIFWGAFNWRADIMRIWPPSTRAYAALGLTEPQK